MNKEEFYQLIKQWSHDTAALSWHKKDHPAYLKALQAGAEVIPWALERLKDSIGHDSGKDFDHDNSPWFSTCLLCDLTNNECMVGFNHKYDGMLVKIREHILKWGKDNNYLM